MGYATVSATDCSGLMSQHRRSRRWYPSLQMTRVRNLRYTKPESFVAFRIGEHMARLPGWSTCQSRTDPEPQTIQVEQPRPATTNGFDEASRPHGKPEVRYEATGATQCSAMGR